MRKPVNYIVLFLITMSLIASAQDASLCREKYWIYRERIKNFVVSGDCRGCASPATSRARDDQNNAQLDWSDPPWMLGYWIGNLAMEYKLLTSSGLSSTSDAVMQTKKELFYAIDVINELDANAEYMYGCSSSLNDPSNLNGFMLSGFQPSNFASLTVASENNKTVADMLNESLVPPPDGWRITCINSALTHYETGREMSKDHLVALSIGFALVKRCVPEWESYDQRMFMANQTYKFVEEVQIISDRIVSYIASNKKWRYLNKCTGECVQGISNPINIYECLLDCSPELGTDGKYRCDEEKGCERGGANSIFSAVGLTSFNEHLQSGCNCPREVTAAFFKADAIAGTSAQWEGALALEEDYILTIAALSNTWTLGMSTKQVAKEILQQSDNHHLEHLILLHRLLYGDQHKVNGDVISLDNSFYECMLERAPCRGFDGQDNTGKSFEWGCNDRLDGSRGCSDGGGWSTEANSGIPFMFYYNLYNLINPTFVADDRPIEIKKLALSDIVKENYEEYDKKNFMAANTIKAGKFTPGKRGYLIDNVPAEGQGRVNFIAGGYIDLQPGFEIKNGATLNAYIDKDIAAGTCHNLYPTEWPCGRPKRAALDQEGEEHLDGAGDDYSILPNPSSGVFFLFLHKDLVLPAKVEVYDLMGKVLYSSEIQNLRLEIDLSPNPKGIYFAKINTQEGVHIEKLIIQ